MMKEINYPKCSGKEKTKSGFILKNKDIYVKIADLITRKIINMDIKKKLR